MKHPAGASGASPHLGAGRFQIEFTEGGLGQARLGDEVLIGPGGLVCYLRDLRSGESWPIGAGAAWSRRSAAVAEVGQRHRDLEALLTVTVESATPVARLDLMIVHHGSEPRPVDLTTFAEVVLHDPRAHAAHPTFSKLFLQTEFLDGMAALLVSRRPRDPAERHAWLVHASLDGGPVEFETDRARFLGRGRPAGRPAAQATQEPLSGTCGNVLDPCLSLRRRLTLAPGEPVRLGFLLGAAADRAAALTLARRGRGDAVPLELAPPALPPATLDAPNGHGRFDDDGREYVIQVRHGQDGSLVLPPRPWVNVLANETFGCLVSETGAGATWCGNSREHRLTPWFNDPVLDPHGDALYLREETSGTAWSCWPGPAPAAADYEVRHGFGYTCCSHAFRGLAVETLLCVARRAPVRLTRVRVRNADQQARRLSLWSHARLVLGTTLAESAPTLGVRLDTVSGALLAENGAAGPWVGHVAFAAVASEIPGSKIVHGTSRAAFLGDRRDLTTPAFGPLAEAPPPTRGPDAAFSQGAIFELAPGESGEFVFLLGEEVDLQAARRLVAELTRPGAFAAAWHEIRDFWRDGLSGIRVQTPAPELDPLINGWLAYQTLSCRLWGRTAFYQSGGAFGYRDQLQDALALLPLWPELAREQIRLHAAHQFREGDVLHWWHPPLSRGIRTRFADDLLWLPLLTADYVAATGDAAILAEEASYLAARPLAPGEDEAFLEPHGAGETADVYDHCCRAIDRSLRVGAHGLPLFGTGDWNDGMNRVGREGRGESVWMGFFLVAVIDAFAPLCEARGDGARAKRYRTHREGLVAALDEAGWDGAWYRRGYYDDGTPLGSSGDAECRIDALVQAWSVLSRAVPPERARQALDAVEAQLVSEDEGLIRLLTPPFVDTPHDPGYIKGYVAGVRENGGQYTHAALWVVRALAEAGRRDRAAPLLAMLSPVTHTATAAQVARYQVEPYVVAADVYGAAPHVGRGGWTWYTGSSGWMLRVALESILGLRTEGGETLVLAPCIPDAWPGYRLRWRVPQGATVYDIEVVNPEGCAERVIAASCDDAEVPCRDGVVRVPLARDQREHRLRVTLGKTPGGRS